MAHTEPVAQHGAKGAQGFARCCGDALQRNLKGVLGARHGFVAQLLAAEEGYVPNTALAPNPHPHPRSYPHPPPCPQTTCKNPPAHIPTPVPIHPSPSAPTYTHTCAPLTCQPSRARSLSCSAFAKSVSRARRSPRSAATCEHKHKKWGQVRQLSASDSQRLDTLREAAFAF